MSFAGTDMLKLLLNICPDAPVTDSLLVEACCNPEALSLLLERSCDVLPIEQMIAYIGRDSDRPTLDLLLDRNLVPVDEMLSESVAPNPLAVRSILHRQPNVPITHEALVAANDNINSLRMLLNDLKDNSAITEKLVRASLHGFTWMGGGVRSRLLTRFVVDLEQQSQ